MRSYACRNEAKRLKHLDEERLRQQRRLAAEWSAFYATCSWWERLLYRLFKRRPSGWDWNDTP